MAISKCVSCNGKKFEIKSGNVINPKNLMSIKSHFVQCSNCGGVVSVFIGDLPLSETVKEEI